jgi:hypothetical protein
VSENYSENCLGDYPEMTGWAIRETAIDEILITPTTGKREPVDALPFLRDGARVDELKLSACCHWIEREDRRVRWYEGGGQVR